MTANIRQRNPFAIGTLLVSTAIIATFSLTTETLTQSAWSFSRGPKKNNPSTAQPTTHSITNLQVKDTVIGTGKTAEPGHRVFVHYTGRLHSNGSVFDSSLTKGRPFSFILGRHQVIDGWEKGVEGMKVGGKRTLTIPPDLAYGDRGVPGVIPPSSVLTFDIELLNVLSP